MSVPEKLLYSFCTLEWADKYCSEVVFIDTWEDASVEKRESALKSATDFIDLFVTFYNDKGDPFYYQPAENSDWFDDVIPRRLKQACVQEAVYLLSLDDNPAEPHPLTILGMLSADGKRFNTDMTPPIFPLYVVKMLKSLGGDVDPETTGTVSMQVKSKLTTC